MLPNQGAWHPMEHCDLGGMASSTQKQALSLYRRLLRAARHWQGSTEEAEYIRQEARQQFRSRQGAAGEELVQALEEGEKRLELALHYGIAYPRLFHADQFEKVPYVAKPQLEEQGDPQAITRGIKDQGVAAKLAAAAARRRQRQAQQQQQAGLEGQPGSGSSGGGGDS